MSSHFVFRSGLLLALALIAGCAASNSKPDLPFPAFVDTDEIEDQFLAALPGIRAKEFTSDIRTRTMSDRVDIPPDWKGSTGGAPGKSLEIFVLKGQLKFSDFELGPGGYAYVPPGSLGFTLESDFGAQILYFLDEIVAESVIRSPIILDSSLLPWESLGDGLYRRTLRSDPGSGATTWLLRIEPGAWIPWESSSVQREGYMVSGQYRHSECLAGKAATWDYLPV
jgi:quercetin dioxygenase-like cupin family protein